MNYLKNKSINSDALLFYTFCTAFFSMPMGTTPPTIFAILGGGIWIFSGKIKTVRQYSRHSWVYPVLLFMVLPWIGLFYTPDPWGFGIEYARKTHYWLYCLAIACIPFEHFSIRKLIQAFLLGLFVNAVAGTLQFAGVLPAIKGWYCGFGRGYSTLSAYLVVGILMTSFYLKQSDEKKKQCVFISLMLFYFFHLIILEGRSGYITFALVAPMVVNNILRKKSFFKISMVYILIIGLMMLSPIVRNRIALSIQQIKYHMNADPESAWGKEYTFHQDRFYMWYGAVSIFLEHPLSGVGTGGYTILMKQSGKPEWPVIAHPHNDFLYMAVSYGIIGIFAYIWLFGELLKNGLKNRYKDSGYFVLSVALVILASGLFNAQILDAGMAFLLAFTVGLQEGFESQTARKTIYGKLRH